MAVIRKSLECVSIPTMVMIRHHNNGFAHKSEEVELLCE
jgi:copper homeostasis protein CutC